MRLATIAMLVVGLAAIAVGLIARESTVATPAAGRADASIAVYRAGLSRLDSALARLDAVIATRNETAAQHAFREARAAYKRVELFVEYHGSFLARELNGVPIPQAEQEDPETPLAPVGLQVVEAHLFPRFDTAAAPRTRELIGYMRTAVASLRVAGADTMPGDAYLFDAVRQEIARVSTLGMAGFDATVTGDAIVESAEALVGIRDALAPYERDGDEKVATALRTLEARLDSAIAYLRANPDFEQLDRLEFITQYANPASQALADAQRALAIGPPPQQRAWSARSASIFDRDAFDPMFFAAGDAPTPTPALVSLGRELFFDPALSSTGTRSCASCHLPERAFADGRARTELFAGHGRPSAIRNTPTLINAALQPALFADNRVRTLEDQASDVLGSPGEMGGTLHGAAESLRGRPGYSARFGRALGIAEDTALSARTLRLVLAAYVRSLTALNSPFDRAVRGDTAALTADERAGFTVFMGKAQCGTCHFAPLFNGAIPPMLLESEVEVIGVPSHAVKQGATVDPDSGRFNVRRIDQHLHAFRTPTLRNIELTAPYMHNGVFKTLEEVIDFYDGGGGNGIGLRLSHQTLPADSLHLTAREKSVLLSFLRTLADTSGITRRP